MIQLRDYQKEAIDQLKNGSILCGGVGSGKSRTALGYFYFKECKGQMKVNGEGSYREPLFPRDLYIITTAKKRDSLEWDKECVSYLLSKDPTKSVCGIKVTIDSWNNIQKYKKAYGAFFIFDEQRVVGSGAWVKAFLDISRKNHWILLSATPGDQWKDYIPVFIANGFYRNKTEFYNRHCVFSRQTKYLKIDRYLDEKYLESLRDSITVYMADQRNTVRHYILVDVNYNKAMYKTVFRDRWDPYDNEPIPETGKLFYLMRKVVNSDPSRIEKVAEIIEERECCIIFYNFTYELEALKRLCKDIGIKFKEWNGQKHEELPKGQRWVYLVQYAAGSEGWNCVTTDTVIFFSQSYSYRMTEQAAGRIDRMNTPFTDLYYYKLRSTAPIDLAIYKALSRKKNFNEHSFIKN